MKILLFGGSFDPPHAGHRRLLSAGLRALRPAVAYLLPAFRSPLKAAHRASGNDRLRMTRLLAEDVPEARGVAEADPFEIRRGRKTFTFETLRHFRARHPGADLWFLAGSDALAGLDRWRRPEELRRSLKWLVGRRPGAPALPRGVVAKILPGRFPDASSTEVRRRLLTAEETTSLVPSAIRRYILRRRLYGLGLRAELRRSLSAERYGHTLAVARLAAELAGRHGLDGEAAALAGLLHDCGRRLDSASMIRYARRRRLPVPTLSAVARHAPILAHAFVGADVARRLFGVRDARVLSAIRNHTLGRAGMTRFDRLLYAADAASEDRGFPEAAAVRRLARRDLDAAFVEAARLKLRYVVAMGQWLHPRTASVWNWALGLPEAPGR